MTRRETLEGYVVDVACIRKYPQDELLERARRHTRDCALHGHCIESGYGLVTDDGRALLLDAKATRLVVDRVMAAPPEHGIRLRAEREEEGGEMVTHRVERVDAERERATKGAAPTR